MGSRATPTCTVEAGAAMGSESWLCPRPTSHPRQWIVCGKYSAFSVVLASDIFVNTFLLILGEQ